MATARLRKWFFSVALVAAAWGMLSSPAAALCATCYTTAASAGTKVIEALKSGILVLLIPTLAIFVGLLVFAFRRRGSDSFGDEPRGEESNWEDGLTVLPTCESKGAPLL